MSDTSPPSSENHSRFRPFAEILMGLRFLTRLPIPFTRTIDPPRLVQAMRFFGVAGGIIGALNGAVLTGLHWLNIPSIIAAILACSFGLMVTGALHEDGLADSADGLFGGRDREHRLLIMKDSRIGSFGACALIMAIFLRVSIYQILLGLPWFTLCLVLAAAGAFSRAMVVDLLWATRPARSDGLSVMAGRPGRNGALFAIITAGLFTLYACAFVAADAGIWALAAAGLLTAAMRHMAIRHLGGQTGDICGAVQVIAELGMLIAIVTRIG
ncbi:MAG: adenosylcobinamide-GDP ribazoletransferase [Alphaproteobacteria bacterium]|nr:adenosylcobinamide-GDP ribazoletransferase [Alphaproteobacteria bacterium]